MQLTFDQAAHLYRLNGVVIPSVTQILEDDGQIIPNYPSVGDFRVRGQRVHQATHLYDTGELHKYQLGSLIMPYVKSYILLMEELQWQWLKIEHRMFNPVLAYAGTADRIRLNPPAIIDLKTGFTKRETGLQTAGYVLAALHDPEIKKVWGNLHPFEVERIKFSLQSDGEKAKPEYCTNQLDFDVFRGLVHKYAWKRQK